MYQVCNFTISVTNNNFNNLTIFVQHFFNLDIDNTTTAGINYKEQYDCKWDPVTLTNNIMYKRAFKFL